MRKSSAAWSLGLLVACSGCNAFRGPGPQTGEVGHIFAWQVKAPVAVSDSGCPSDLNLEELKTKLPGSYLFVRLDTLEQATNVQCTKVFDTSTCTAVDAASGEPTTYAVAGALYTATATHVVKQLAPGCALLQTWTYRLDDLGNHADLTLGIHIAKDTVPACAAVHLAGANGQPIDACDISLAANASLVNVGTAK